MKIAKIMALWLALSGSAFAAGLDASDAGEYVLLDKDQRPTQMQMRYYQRSTQWMMDGKNGNSPWSPVCQGTANAACKLPLHKKCANGKPCCLPNSKPCRWRASTIKHLPSAA